MGILANENSIGGGNYLIERSLRFQSASSQYLTRTFGSSPNGRIMTFSFWAKRGLLGSGQYYIFSGYDGTSANLGGAFFLNDNLYLDLGGVSAYRLVTTQVFRDPSAWYHIVFAIDTTQATAANRVIFYVNGQQITSYSTANYPIQNYVTNLLMANANNKIGANPNNVATYDGYFTEINVIDGQALTPSSFGETDPLTGVWIAKKYTGTYGTNGFYLKFNDGTNTTTLGQDRSGNANNWTLTNFTRSAGVSDCWMYDVPSGNGGVSATQPSSNYCVINPITRGVPGFNGAVAITFSRGNLQANWSTGSYSGVLGTVAIPLSGKWYWEITVLGGLNTSSAGISTSFAEDGGTTAVQCIYDSGGIYSNGTAVQTGLATITTNDILGIAWDADASSIRFYKNNVALGSAQSYTRKANVNYYPTAGQSFSGSATSSAFNFGQRSFAYTPPSGFKALCTANLPTPTIAKGNKQFDVNIWTGNGTSQTITNSGLMAPSFVWIKSRSVNGYYHVLTDAVRGITKALYSNATDAENTLSTRITALNSNGFSLGTSGDVNDNNQTFVGWQWDAGSSTVTNTSGSISSQVRANTTAGVSIVTYTGNGTSGATVGHGLGVKPAMVILKTRTGGTETWPVWQKSLASESYFLRLNETSATYTNAGRWSAFSSTTITLGNNSETNGSGYTYVAYCFAEIAGFSRFGSYTGNGSADGPFVYCGFRPKFIMIKRTDAAGAPWQNYDTARSTFNATKAVLYPNLSNAEGTWTNGIDILSNGFKIRESNTDINANGGTYIYMAFAESPFNYSNSR